MRHRKPPLKACAECGNLQPKWADYYLCDKCVRKNIHTLDSRKLRKELKNASTH